MYNNYEKWEHKKTCTVCLYPIVFKKDTYFKRNKNNGISYPLNIHYGACSTKVYLDGDSAWEVSKRNPNKIQQLKLLFR